MANKAVNVLEAKRPRISLDTWAVIVALALAVVVKLGLFTKVPW